MGDWYGADDSGGELGCVGWLVAYALTGVVIFFLFWYWG